MTRTLLWIFLPGALLGSLLLAWQGVPLNFHHYVGFAALFARQRNTPPSSGTLPTHSFLFGILLTACLITMVALSYLPVLALGPILERLLYGA